MNVTWNRVDQLQDPASSSNTRHSMAKHLLPSSVKFVKILPVDGSRAVFSFFFVVRKSASRLRYSRLFDWLVWRINQSTAGNVIGSKKDPKITER